MDTQQAHTEPKTQPGALRRAACALAHASERLQAYRPACSSTCSAAAAVYLSTSLAGALRVAAALLAVVA
jgi:hypothetical protein